MDTSRTFRSILVGDNGAPEAQHAVEVALALSHCCHAKLVVLGVLTPQAPEQEAEGVGLEKTEAENAALRSKLEQTREAGRAQGIEVVCELVRGRAEPEIERFVKEYAVDLLVVGHRDILRPRRWLEGSTSEELAHKLDVSILIVHGAGPR